MSAQRTRRRKTVGFDLALGWAQDAKLAQEGRVIKYTGSKSSHADEILKVVLAKRRRGQHYIEPFIGGANVFVKVPHKDGPRIGADLNGFMIALHRALAAGWKPPTTMTEAQFNDIRDHQDKHPPELVAFAATGCTFGSMWFSTFVTENEVAGAGYVSGTRAKTEGMGGNRCGQSARSCLRDAPFLKGAKFIHSSYDQLDIPPRSLIYCDPPYVSTVGYEGSAQSIAVGEQGEKNVWRAYKFWRWADQKVDEGHTVFVSEYAGPTADAFPLTISLEAKAEVARLAAAAKIKQQDSKCPAVEVQGAVDAWLAAKAHAEKTATSKKDAWKVVWEKEVAVNINAVGIDVEARDGLKQELVQVESDLEVLRDKVSPVVHDYDNVSDDTVMVDNRTKRVLDHAADIEKKQARAAELRRMIDATSAGRRVERLFHREG